MTSQQKDLLIIHLKGEVYELKLDDNDYQSLLMQIQTVEQRIRKATQERDQAQYSYDKQLGLQQQEIQAGHAELQETKRGIKQKESE